MPAPQRLLVIANPIAGGGRGRTLAPELAFALRQRGVASSLHFTTSARDARDRARTAGVEPFDGLVVVGGDGTLNEVLNGMPDPTRPLGVLPVGTANVLALELELPRKPQFAAEVIARGRTRTLAIGCAGDRRFLLFAGAGIDGAVVERLHQVRTGTLGKHKWAGPILHTLWRWPRFRLRATFADGSALDDLASVLVTRVRNYGGVVQLVPGIQADDGQLHVLCFRRRGRAWWAWQGLRGCLRLMRPGPDLIVRHTASLRIDGEAPVQIDGDFAGRTPLAIGLEPRAARIFAPC